MLLNCKLKNHWLNNANEYTGSFNLYFAIVLIMRRYYLSYIASIAPSYCHFSTNQLYLGKVISFPLTDIGEGILKVQIINWHVEIGATVDAFDPLCEVESDKATINIPSPVTGVIKHIYSPTGAEAYVGKQLVDIETLDDSTTDLVEGHSPITSAPTNDSFTESKPILPAKSIAVPAVRAICKQHNIDIKLIKGTGKDGRVTKQDVYSHINKDSTPSSPIPSPISSSSNKHDCVETCTNVTVIPLNTGMRRAMVETMTNANNIPSFTACDELNITLLVQAKRELQQLLDKSVNSKLKLSMLPLFIKAASLALNEFPELNAHTHNNCTELHVHKPHNIGFAMDAPKGLVVPVIRDVASMSITDIIKQLDILKEKGKKNKLSREDLTGATFNLSNIGSVGATYTSPIIPPPCVAIGAIGRMQTLPRFGPNNTVEQAHIVTVSWSADHRVVDGATMVRYNNLFKSYIENPVTMLLHLH